MANNSSNGRKIDDYSREELLDLVKDLKKRKKFGLVWEAKPEDVVEHCKKELPVLQEVKERVLEKAPNQPTDLIIEGDNYHALSVLNYTHAGKVDVIYIDPPYNTGAKDWKYNNDYVDVNDTFRHSKWLAMMHSRLLLAKNLLKEDGVLICAIDENEHAHLGVLLEELFPNKETHPITIVHNPRGVQGQNFSYTHEFAYFVIPAGQKIIGKRKIDESEIDWRNLRDNGGESLRKDARNCFYPIEINPKTSEIVGFGDVCANSFHPKSANVKRKGNVLVYAVDPSDIERKWRYARQSVESIAHLLRAREVRGVWQIEIGKDFGVYRTVWADSRYDANEYGTKLLKKIVPKCDFNFPKSIYNTYDCLHAVVGGKKDALILDYFAGTGTTGHAVMELNKDDGGKRSFILCTDNENKIAEACTYPRIVGVIKGYEGVKGIPSNIRYFKTAFVPRDKVSDDTRKALVVRSTEMICVRENTFEKVHDNKAFKIYTNGKIATGILFDLDSLEDFKKKLLTVKLPSHLYVFSLSNDVFAEDFAELPMKHKLCPIPESILEVYRKIFA